ncbi:hypothetical protein QA541_09315 [Macrococcus psychrotolerans]|uniref:Uncharacterized protein n=1 Tax=Macrococcus psychrotolerans TaxID=3039389 RepID=A0AAU6R8N7_9STAP
MMKKILLGLFIVFLAIGAIRDTKDYVLGNDLTDLEVESGLYSGQYLDYEEASSAMSDAMGEKFSVKANHVDRTFKLPNGHYYSWKMMDGDYKRSQYLYTGFIENISKDTTELTFPENEFNLVSVNGKFEQKTWDIKSKAGVHHFQSGAFSKATKLEDRIMTNDDESEGVTVATELKDGVIQMNEKGIWLNKANNKVGMNEPMKAFDTEEAAVSAATQEVFGKSVGVIKSKNMNFHIYQNKVDAFNEYTVISVRLKEQQYYAGQYERFTFIADTVVDTHTEEAVEGITYKLHFQHDVDKLKQYKKQLKDGHMYIGVEVRGEDYGK